MTEKNKKIQAIVEEDMKNWIAVPIDVQRSSAKAQAKGFQLDCPDESWGGRKGISIVECQRCQFYKGIGFGFVQCSWREND